MSWEPVRRPFPHSTPCRLAQVRDGWCGPRWTCDSEAVPGGALEVDLFGWSVDAGGGRVRDASWALPEPQEDRARIY